MTIALDRNDFTGPVAFLCIGATSLALLTLAILHVVRTDLDPSRVMISEYAIGAHGWLMTLCFFSYAVASASLLIALTGCRDAGSASKLFWVGIICLAAAAFGPLLAAFFQADPMTTPAAAMTRSGRMHGVSFMIGVPGELFATLFLSLVLGARAPWSGHWLFGLTAFVWLSLAIMAGAMILTVARHHPDPGIVGWTNRAFMVGYAFWVAAAAWPIASGRR